MEIFNNLPDEAQKEGYNGERTSYTLKRTNCPMTIGVLLDKGAFYVKPVQELPPEYSDYSINKQGGANVAWSNDEAWLIAKAIAGWS